MMVSDCAPGSPPTQSQKLAPDRRLGVDFVPVHIALHGMNNTSEITAT
jgi:hypothetical protein